VQSWLIDFTSLLSAESDRTTGCMMDKHLDQEEGSNGGFMIAYALLASSSLIVCSVSLILKINITNKELDLSC
jgi:hypothetical protein